MNIDNFMRLARVERRKGASADEFGAHYAFVQPTLHHACGDGSTPEIALHNLRMQLIHNDAQRGRVEKAYEAITGNKCP